MTAHAKIQPVPFTIIDRLHRAPLPSLTRILYDGEYYTVNDHLLPALERGETPFELELDADEDDEAML